MTQMSMGANIPLSATNVRASLRWTGGNPGVPDVDVSALLLDESGEVASDADFVFYNQPNHYSGSVRIAGKTPPPQASDSIDVDLSKVPEATERIVLAASADGGPFGQVPELQMVLSDLASGQSLAYFPIQASMETAMVSAELYRRSGAWKFRAVGQGYASGLAGLAADFGIDTGHADSGGSAAPENRADVAPPPVAPPQPAPQPVAPPPVAEAPIAPPAPTPPAAYPEPVPPAAAPPAPPADFPPAPPGFAPPAPAGYAPSGPPIESVPAPPQSYPAPDSYAPPNPYPPPEAYPAPTLEPPAGEQGGFSAPTLVEPQAAAAPPAPPMAAPAEEMAAPMAPPQMPAPEQPAPLMPTPQQPPAAPPAGGGISLQKNQKVELRNTGPTPLSRVVFSLGWQPPEGRGEVDMDASVIAFDGTGEKLAIVWYMHLNEFAGALQHTGDNRTGGTGDVEQIMVDLVRMPANVSSLIFTINCFRGGTFTDIANAFCSVHNVDDGQELVRFDLADTQPSTALLMADLRRAGSAEWQMRAIGEFHDFRTVKKLLPAAARQATMG